MRVMKTSRWSRGYDESMRGRFSLIYLYNHCGLWLCDWNHNLVIEQCEFSTLNIGHTAILLFISFGGTHSEDKREECWDAPQD
jgi:hypothetical protein